MGGLAQAVGGWCGHSVWRAGSGRARIVQALGRSQNSYFVTGYELLHVIYIYNRMCLFVGLRVK